MSSSRVHTRTQLHDDQVAVVSSTILALHDEGQGSSISVFELHKSYRVKNSVSDPEPCSIKIMRQLASIVL